MLIKWLQITNTTSIECFSCRFFDGLSIIKHDKSDIISSVFRLLCNHREAPIIPIYEIKSNTKIEASVIVNGESYHLTALPDETKKSLILKAFQGGREATDEYLYLTEHCAEQDLSDIFDGKKSKQKSAPLRLLDYSTYDRQNDDEISILTDGFSRLPTFNSYLRNFLKSLTPQNIGNGKHYLLKPDGNGIYNLKCETDNGSSAHLSKAESVLLRYLCFLQASEFWSEFEEIRNHDAIKKPLLITNLLEQFDETISATDVIEKAMATDRQAIIFITC